jgi:hypothetical protein
MTEAPPERQGTAGPVAIGVTTDRLTRRPFGRRGFATGALVAEWPLIVGTMLGDASLPQRISFPRGERSNGTLYIRVASGALAMQIQHLEPLLLQRINGYFGYAAVARVSISQGPVPRRVRPSPPAAPVLSEAEEKALTDQVGRVDDPELRAILAALGRHLAANR